MSLLAPLAELCLKLKPPKISTITIACSLFYPCRCLGLEQFPHLCLHPCKLSNKVLYFLESHPQYAIGIVISSFFKFTPSLIMNMRSDSWFNYKPGYFFFFFSSHSVCKSAKAQCMQL